MTDPVNNNVKYLNWCKEAFSWGYEADLCWVDATFYSCPYSIIDMTDPVNNIVKYLNWREEAVS